MPARTDAKASAARLKVLYVINGLGPGGAERSLVELLPFLDAAGIDMSVACLTAQRYYADAVRAQGSATYFLQSKSLLGWAAELRRLLAACGPDILHTTIFDANIVGRLAAAGTHTTVLTSLVNTAYDPSRLTDPNVKRWKLALCRELDGLTARRLTTHFHAITETVKAAAVRALRILPQRVSVVPRGRDARRLGTASAERKQAVRTRLGIDADTRVLLNVGRHEHPKGQGCLLEALPFILRQEPRARLLIAGRAGHATASLHALCAEHGLQQHVEFLGHREDVADLLAAADLFVFPSLYEGMGGAVIEAMALSLPVVGSDIGALREVVEDGASGRLVPAADSAALARQVVELLRDTATASQFGRRGRELFEQKYTIERSAQSMARLYQSLAAPE